MLLTSCSFLPSDSDNDDTLCYVSIVIDGCITIGGIEIFKDTNPMTNRLEYVLNFPCCVDIKDRYIRSIIHSEILERYRLWKENL